MHNPSSSPAKPAKPVKLFVGLPIYAQVPAQFMQCLLALQAYKPCDLELQVCQGDGVARSRNQLTATFLASDCTHLLFIDCDILFRPEHIARILSHDAPIVGGMYPKKQDTTDIEWVINTLPYATKPDEKGLQPVRYIGTGFMCIRREVFVKMIERFPEIQFTADYGDRREEHDFWPMGVHVYPDGHRRYLSEDWFFCERAMIMGIPVVADTRCVLRHIGPAIYPLKSQEREHFPASALDLIRPGKNKWAEPPEGFCRPEHAASDAAAWAECVVNNEYRLPERFHPNAVVVDIGAHIGSFGVACFRRGASRIYSFEPDAENAQHCARNAANTTSEERWSVTRAAVCRAGETRDELPWVDWKQLGNNPGEGRVSDAGTSRVPCATITHVLNEASNFCTRRIALLKLDCEGAEWEILRNAPLTFVDAICAELHLAPDENPETRGEPLVESLRNAGFDVTVEPHPRLAGRPMLWAKRMPLTPALSPSAGAREKTSSAVTGDEQAGGGSTSCIGAPPSAQISERETELTPA